MAQRTDYWREFWLCAVCGATNTRDDTVGLDHYEPSDLERELDPCLACRATWRQRATVVAVLHGLASMSGPISDRAHDHSTSGLGISDDSLVAAALARAFDYVNTDLHRFPRLDLKDTSTFVEKFDFVTCSEVLEHVLPPATDAIRNLAGLLSRGGFAVVSVPVFAEEFKEHYPGITSWRRDGEVVVWLDEHGTEHRDTEPRFHAGSGETLELREWSDTAFKKSLIEGGFATVETAPEVPTLGVPHVPNMGVYLARL